MSKTLSPPTDRPRLLAPTTTKKLAQRILAASRLAADGLPAGFLSTAPWDIMLTLHVAEDEARYPAARNLDLPGNPSVMVVSRWLAVLEEEGLICRQHGLLALSEAGDERVTAVISAIYAAQRKLD